MKNTPVEDFLSVEIDRICGTDRTAMFGRQQMAWLDAYQSLRAQEVSEKGVTNWEKWYYGRGQWALVAYQQDWRGKKGDRPTPTLIASTYGQFKADVVAIRERMASGMQLPKRRFHWV